MPIIKKCILLAFILDKYVFARHLCIRSKLRLPDGPKTSHMQEQGRNRGKDQIRIAFSSLISGRESCFC